MSYALERARHRRRSRVPLLIVGGLLVALAVGAATGGASAVSAACGSVTMRPRALGGDTLLTASGGQPLGYVPTSQNRELVSTAEMSSWLPRATVDVEDRRFWQHGALDALGIVRSAFADLKAGHVVQGASTITQQLVRNRYLDGKPMTASRKLTEACLAVRLYRQWPRSKILNEYLNTAYYGHHARGVQAAAWTYFSRPASKLTLTQSALIAGLVQAPTDDDPLVHPGAARRRRNEVLGAMLAAKSITPARYRAARAAPLHLRPGDHYGGVRSGPFFAAARAELQQRVGAGATRHGGLHVQTTLNSRLQRLAQHAIGNWISAPGDPASALVSIDPRNGRVLALATRAPGVKSLDFDLATQSRRQAGSAFKVFTLATALEQGISLNSTWNGPPSLTIPDPRCENANGPWDVHNFADETSGTMTLADALAHSVNTIFAQVAVKVGPENIVKTAHRMGIRTKLTPVCSITLGPEGVSPLELTDAFATLADGGVRHAPEFLRSVTRDDGTAVALPSHARRGVRALPPQIASSVTSALTGVIRHGTATAAAIGRPAAGKTGTAENEADAWFCGFTPQLATCVWVGYAQGEIPMTALDGFSPVVGGSVPARIWHDFMSPALAGRPVEPLR
ncbi:MAG TPA: transglycosylase domain-containing protein [Solirubrobacter sp.]|nr:transglycosylase domain-containing protein [Solirubrobacter sp.]